MHDQKFLNDYFSNHWCSTTSKYIYSGYAIAEKISDFDTVIDIGCGSNPFKSCVNDLVGIDPATDQADIKTTLEDFIPEYKFDVALCLGSINFGTDDIIAKQIECVNNLLDVNARVFWRLNPGQHDHQDPLCRQIDFYPWTFEKLKRFAEFYDFEQTNCALDWNTQHVRLYAEWHR